MRRRGVTLTSGVDPFAKPDIRTLYITFLLSFVTPTTPIPLKVALLEDHRDAFVQIFKGIGQDPYEVVRRLLETCWEGIWSDGRLKRTTKVRLFNEATLTQASYFYFSGIMHIADGIFSSASYMHGTNLKGQIHQIFRLILLTTFFSLLLHDVVLVSVSVIVAGIPPYPRKMLARKACVVAYTIAP